MGVVDTAVKNGVGERGIADEGVPFVGEDLAGDEDTPVAVALLDDWGIEFLGPAQRPREPGVAASAAATQG